MFLKTTASGSCGASLLHHRTDVFVLPKPGWLMVVNFSSLYNKNGCPSQYYGYRHQPTHFSAAGSSRNIQELTYYFPFFSRSYSNLMRYDE